MPGAVRRCLLSVHAEKGRLSQRGSEHWWQRPRTRTKMHLGSAVSLCLHVTSGGRKDLNSFWPPSAVGANRDVRLSKLSLVTRLQEVQGSLRQNGTGGVFKDSDLDQKRSLLKRSIF